MQSLTFGEAKDIVDKLEDIATSLGVTEVSDAVLKNDKFLVWSAAPKPETHHYGKFGLLVHTNEVVQLALQNNVFFKTINKGVEEAKVFLAGLFHDVGKIWDYRPVTKDGKIDYNEWENTDHRFKIHHINRSALVWSKAVSGTKHEGMHDEVLHAILSHHGRPEWGSAIVPQTRLAYLLHLSDCLSARMEDCKKFC